MEGYQFVEHDLYIYYMLLWIPQHARNYQLQYMHSGLNVWRSVSMVSVEIFVLVSTSSLCKHSCVPTVLRLDNVHICTHCVWNIRSNSSRRWHLCYNRGRCTQNWPSVVCQLDFHFIRIRGSMQYSYEFHFDLSFACCRCSCLITAAHVCNELWECIRPLYR